jgi:hypothetical protein
MAIFIAGFSGIVFAQPAGVAGLDASTPDSNPKRAKEK